MLNKAGYYLTESFNLLILYPDGYGKFASLGYRRADIFSRIKCEWETMLLNENEIVLLNKTTEYTYMEEL